MLIEWVGGASFSIPPTATEGSVFKKEDLASLISHPRQKLIVGKPVYKFAMGREADTPLYCLFLPFLPILAQSKFCFYQVRLTSALKFD